MDYTVVDFKGLFVAGISLHIEQGNSPTEIGALWQDIMTHNKLAKIENKTNNHMVGMYTDYEGDHTQPMNVVIGVPVDQGQSVPEGYVLKSAQAGKYAVFTASTMQDVGVTWAKIWNTDLKRTYKADFELYKMDGSPVEIYVGIE